MAGIYIHIPFCKQACHYCDFHFSTTLNNRDQMIEALCLELELRQTEFNNITVETIYFGGGTPSLLTNDELDKILNTVYKYYSISEQPEITLEANPDDLTKDKIIALSKSAINRLSIGIQSFFEDDLKFMNRAHNAKEALACLQVATQYFNNISVDLIYGIQNSTKEKWLKNIQSVLDFNIPHVSCYALTVEPKTALASFIQKGIIDDVDEVLASEQFYNLKEKLETSGYVHYELSNFGKPDFFSRNNTAYWQGKPYLGIGPSAHGYNGKERSWNVRNNSKYIKVIQQKQLPTEIEVLSDNDRYNEYIMTGLRTILGVSFNKVEKNYGKIYKTYLLEASKTLIHQDLLYIEAEHLYVTKKGQFLSDGIASQLFKID